MEYQVHMEEFDTVDIPDDDTPLDELVEQCFTANRKVQSLVRTSEQLAGVINNYCTVRDHVRKFGVTAASMHLVNHNGNLSKALNIKLPAYESDSLADEVVPEDVDEDMFVESIDGQLKRAKDAVVAFFKRIGEFLKELYEKYIALAGRLLKTMEELQQRFKKNVDMDHFLKIKGSFYSSTDYDKATDAINDVLKFDWASQDMTPDKLIEEFTKLKTEEDTRTHLDGKFAKFNTALNLYGKKITWDFTEHEVDGSQIHVPKLKLEEFDEEEKMLMKEDDVDLSKQFPAVKIKSTIPTLVAMMKLVMKKKDMHKKIENVGKAIANYTGKPTKPAEDKTGGGSKTETPAQSEVVDVKARLAMETDADPTESKAPASGVLLLSQNVTNALVQATNEVVKIAVSKHVLSFANMAKKVKFK